VDAVDLLLPRPHEARATAEAFALSAAPRIRLPSDNPALRAAAGRIFEALRSRGLEPRIERRNPGDAPSDAGQGAIDLHLADAPSSGPGPHPEAYRLSIGASGVRIDGDDEAGLFYGAVTLAQWIALHAGDASSLALPGLSVSDRPDFAHRGALLDVSRNRVPRMDSLLALVDRLAGWKINQLQLYMEHTFAYRDHASVWREASPLTAEELKELDCYCSERFIELVPNQNSFGHFHRWLALPEYRALAERPEGVQHPFGKSVEPFSLCPTDPAAIALVEALWDELLGQFSSRQGNVGLDETFDLGSGRSSEACERRGVGPVYLDYLLQVRRILLERGRRMQFWADMVLAHPELIAKLPGDVIPLVWGYEADHPFAREAEPFAAAGLAFYVCPGTSSWNSLAGRADNALANLRAAALAGKATGAAGYLVTDWGDNGHLQPPSASALGWLAGAACGWRADTETDPERVDWAALLDRHAFPEEPGLGSAALELARCYLQTDVHLKNGSVLFRLLLHADEDLTHPRFEKLTVEGLARAGERITGVLTALDAYAGDRSEAHRELRWSGQLLAFACELGRERLRSGRDTALGNLPRQSRRRLLRELKPILAELPELWLATSRPGGLEDSTAPLAWIARGLG
jgi:hypothetical protein